MLRSRVPLAAAFLVIVSIVSVASADEILVPSSDRDRIIRINDGRQIRLQAGKELVRTNDGRLITRQLAAGQSAQSAQGAQSAQAPRKTPQTGERWIYYVGAQGSSRSVTHKREVATDNLIGSVDFVDEPCGKIVPNGSTATCTKKLSETAFAAAIGVKDTQEQNYYELLVGKSGDLTEISISAAIGFPSYAFLDGKAIPYARALVGAGSEDGIGSFDAFSYGVGIGANYAVNPDVEVFGEADYIIRSFGEKTGTATDKDTGAKKVYGKINTSETEMRLSIGARYLFN